MKKLLYVLAAIVLLISIQIIPAYAAGSVELTVIPDKTDVFPGDTVTFTFAVSNPSRVPIAGLQYTVVLPDGIEYKSHTILCGGYFGAANYNAGAANLFVTNTAALEGMDEANWQVMTITCDVREDLPLGEKTVSLEGISLYGGLYLTDIPYASGAAKVTVSHNESQHVWDEQHSVVSRPPTCTAAGERVYTCATNGCGKTKREEIPASGHSFVVAETPASCTAPGKKVTTCKNCDYYSEETIAQLDHVKGDVVENLAPSCLEDGKITYKCALCGTVIEVWTETITALGHEKPADEESKKLTKEPTCTETGEAVYLCPRCGEEVTETVAATGHAWDEGKVTLEATTTTKGEKVYTCVRCGETMTEEIPVIAATSTPTTAASPTATPTASAAPTSSPKTGDDAPVALYGTMLALCAGALILTLTRKKRVK